MADQLEELLRMVDEARAEVVGLTQELVRMETVNFGRPESGDELPAAELIRDRLAAEGIAAEVYPSAPNRGNVVGTLGQGDGATLLYMSHTDVVPVEDPGQWTHPPFGAEIAEGRIWGRGAADMKSTAAAQAMALILLQRAGLPLRGTLRLASCADEEAGGAFGFGWMAEHHPELLRADLAINEGGGAPVRRGDTLIYPISTGEKGRLEAHYHISGRGYHASQPWMADNAIYKADDLIQRIRAYQPEVSTDIDLFQHLNTLAGVAEPVTRDNLEEVLAQVAEGNRTLASMLRAASRLTLVASMIDGGVKSNSVAENCTVVCDIRSLPSQDKEYVRSQLQGLTDGLDGVSLELIETAVSNSSPFASPYRALVEQATRDAVGEGAGELAFVPGLTVGFTDSRFVRPLGDVAYGFVPLHPNDDPSLSGAHNINESFAIDSLLTATKFHLALAYRTLVTA